MLNRTRTPFVAAALLAAGVVCSSVRADDVKAGMMMADNHSRMAVEQVDKAKMMAADPAQAPAMTVDMAKMMVMDHMAMTMAKDPAVQRAAMDAMMDPAMMKVHGDARKMAADPEQVKKLEAAIMADPMAMKMVLHESMTMAMAHDKMGGGMMGEGKKTMDDKMGGMKK